MRRYLTLHDNWYFTKQEQAEVPTALPTDWETVSIPHTWNALDGQDGGNDYHRAPCWYVKALDLPQVPENTCVYVEFEAASAYCEVYVNGKKAASHAGGYSRFRAEISALLTEKENILAVMVDNKHQDHIYPQMADFTFYGGIYRDVKLVCVPKTHLCMDYYGSEALTAASEIVGDHQARLTLHAYVSEAEALDQLLFAIHDAEGNLVAEVSRPAEADTHAELLLSDLHLWHGVKDPYLYTVKAMLLRHNEVLDEVTVRHGFRSFHVDPQRGFFLNGELTPLRGVSRHQDHLMLGNALTKAQHEEDARLIREVGANTIRLAHYQHSQDFYDLCDEMGFIVWAEIPFISRMNNAPEAHQNCIEQMKELIYQNFNHSSICVWGISNEITIGGNTPKLVENLKELNALVKELDPTRLSVMAQLSALPKEDEQNQITDIVSYNHYFGWYVGTLEDNEQWLDSFHEMHPTRALGISEYGCEGIVTYHEDEPQPGDYSEEYQAMYHEHMAKIIDARPWLWATHIWNMFDFGCDARNEGGVAGRNNKGLVTLDRKVKKDIFYLYQAYWTTAPMVHICSKRYAKRHNETIDVKIYTNAPAVSLYVDGVFAGKKDADHVVVFEGIELHDGFTTITAKVEGCTDTTAFEKVAEPFAPYHFVEDKSETGVTNWFDDVDLDQEREMTFKSGFYSVQDTAKELLKSKEAADILVNALSSLIGMKLKKSMLAVMGDNRFCDSAEAFPSKAEDTQKALAYINEKLQQIPKE